MLRLSDPQLTLWDAILPPEIRSLSEELQKVDAFLDDERFFAPFRERFTARMGRPTVPIETYLRLMYLKFRYQLGYETLVKEVSDSIQWRFFCRIPLDAKVPHSTTLLKLTKRCGPELVEELNKLLLKKACEKKLIRGRKLRVDTTVIEADIHHPTDAGLLSDGVRVISRMVKKIKDKGAAVRTKFQDRTRSIKNRIIGISKVLKKRTGEAYAEVREVTGDIMDIAEKVVSEARQVLINSKHYAWRQGNKGVSKLCGRLQKAIEITEKIINQTREVQRGNRHIPDRVVSIFDQDARPIQKGKLKSPTEFGYKVRLDETDERIITGYDVLKGNPSDDSLLHESIENHETLFGRQPRGVATDRGFGTKDNERLLQEKGVARVSLPRKGKKSSERRRYEKQPWFRRLQRFRAGGEGTISLLKRRYGLRRSLFRGHEGTRTWVGFGVMTHNLVRLCALG